MTLLNTTWVVPQLPLVPAGSNAPGWWYGIQTAAGDGMLIQPILAYGYKGDYFSIFNGVYDWNKLKSWWTSEDGKVSPGDVVESYVKLVTGYNGEEAYEMFVGVKGGFEVTSTRAVDSSQKANESWAMFVLEHQPVTCAAYPPDNQFTFENIRLEVDGSLVEFPAWEASQERPACDSEAHVYDNRTIAITWDTSTTAAAPPSSNSNSPPLPLDEAMSRVPPFPRKWTPASGAGI